MLPVWEYLLPAIRLDDKLLFSRTILSCVIPNLHSSSSTVCITIGGWGDGQILLSREYGPRSELCIYLVWLTSTGYGCPEFTTSDGLMIYDGCNSGFSTGIEIVTVMDNIYVQRPIPSTPTRTIFYQAFVLGLYGYLYGTISKNW
jgi:hypothetical protein